MEAYPKYKESGVEWIGEIPEGWEVKRLRHLVEKVGSGITPKGGASAYQRDGVPLLRSQNIHFDGLKLDDVAFIDEKTHNSMVNSKVMPGDVLLNITGASIGRCYYADFDLGEANVNQHVCIIRPKKKVKTKYLYYILRSDLGQEQINYEQTGSGREGLNFEVLKSFLIPTVSIEEQTSITNYLDQKTTEIDALIAQKQQLIALYEEEKTAIINQAVTRGLDPDAPLKPSGIDWLGDIPEGWEVKKLKYLISMLSGFAFSSKEFSKNGIQLIKIANLYNNKLHLNRQPTFLPESFLETHSDWIVRDGDILMSMTGTLGKRDYGFAILMEEKKDLFFLNQRVSKIFEPREILTKLLVYILRSEYFLNNLFSLPSGTKQGNFSNENILNLSIVFSSDLAEQEAITNFIETETTRINTKIAKTKRIIELQKEYRTALISEVVTGKVKVPQQAAEEIA